MQPTRSYRRLVSDASWTFASFFVPFIVDVAIAAIIFGGFVVFGWLIAIGGASGRISKSHLEYFEEAHFQMNIGLFLAMGLKFILRVVRMIFRGE